MAIIAVSAEAIIADSIITHSYQNYLLQLLNVEN
jgi:hypothetical protein